MSFVKKHWLLLTGLALFVLGVYLLKVSVARAGAVLATIAAVVLKGFGWLRFLYIFFAVWTLNWVFGWFPSWTSSYNFLPRKQTDFSVTSTQGKSVNGSPSQ